MPYCIRYTAVVRAGPRCRGRGPRKRPTVLLYCLPISTKINGLDIPSKRRSREPEIDRAYRDASFETLITVDFKEGAEGTLLWKKFSVLDFGNTVGPSVDKGTSTGNRSMVPICVLKIEMFRILWIYKGGRGYPLRDRFSAFDFGTK